MSALSDLFQDIADAIRTKTGDTGSMKPASFPENILAIEGGGGGSNQKTILAKQNFDGFAVGEGTQGLYVYEIPDSTLEGLVIGEEYTVYWNGETYPCVAIDVGSVLPGVIAIGNGAAFGFSGNSEPFIIAYTAGYGYTLFSLENKTTNEVAIYQAVSGGSSDDVRYVTFMSHDGSVKYGVKPVAVGDDCADPIARGIFTTPTRESTAQYDYAFVGWATTANGAWDETALDAVTEDKTVYAAYASAVRYYTVSFYDGETLLTTQSVAYGSTPSHKPKKDGYDFVGWSPDLAPVTGDASYSAIWKVKAAFGTATWAEISEIIAAGTASSTFSVGDKRVETLTYEDGTTENVEFEIVDLNPSSIGSVLNKAHIAIMATHALSTPVVWDTATVSANSYYAYASIVKTHLAGLVTCFPEDMQAAMLSLPLPFATASSKLHIPTSNFLFGKQYGESGTVSRDMLNAFKNGHSTKYTDADGNAITWWTASAYSYSSKLQANYVTTAGALSYDTQHNTNKRYVVPIFFI